MNRRDQVEKQKTFRDGKVNKLRVIEAKRDMKEGGNKLDKVA